ncbi:hypothetical protein OAK82_03585 [Candidatus Thioglobus sp.]|nr:hypothetical protein [Candidatus Thioglobus sp.]
MTPELRNDYLEALDIPEFLYHKNDSIPRTEIIVQCLLVETSPEKSFCEPGDTKNLLVKMLSSIGLSLNNTTSISIQSGELEKNIKAYPARVVLVMGDSINSNSDNLFFTHHPRDILENPALKREVWEVLKKVKQCLS